MWDDINTVNYQIIVKFHNTYGLKKISLEIQKSFMYPQNTYTQVCIKP